ncbi:hypothetical protein L0152_07235 [bacterium]|nr:hypothetical protein [bacterium]
MARKKEKTQKAFVTFHDVDRECAIGGYFTKDVPVEVPVNQVGNFYGIDPAICTIEIKETEAESESPPENPETEVNNG